MQESANGLLEMVKGLDASMIKVVHLQVKAPVHYVALLPPFINHLKRHLWRPETVVDPSVHLLCYP